MTVAEIDCGYWMGDTCCSLPRRHDGEHEPGAVVVVDRNLKPLNCKRVRRVGGRPQAKARVHEFGGRVRLTLAYEDPVGGVCFEGVDRPSVRVGDRWVRRCPDLEVVEATT